MKSREARAKERLIMKLSRSTRMSFDGQAALCAAYTFLIIQDSIYSETLGLPNGESVLSKFERSVIVCAVIFGSVFCSKSEMCFFFTRNHQSNHFTRGFQFVITKWNEKYTCSDITDLCCCLCSLLFEQNTDTQTQTGADGRICSSIFSSSNRSIWPRAVCIPRRVLLAHDIPYMPQSQRLSNFRLNSTCVWTCCSQKDITWIHEHDTCYSKQVVLRSYLRSYNCSDSWVLISAKQIE